MLGLMVEALNLLMLGVLVYLVASNRRMVEIIEEQNQTLTNLGSNAVKFTPTRGR